MKRLVSLLLTIVPAIVLLALTPPATGVKRPAAKRAPKAAPAKKPATPSVAAKPLSDEEIAARWMKSLTPREQIAQLVVVPFNGHPLNMRLRESRQFLNLVAKEHVGGLILINQANRRLTSRPGPVETASFLNRMQTLAKVPLIVGGDFERGASMRIDSTTVFPHAMAFAATGDPDLMRREGEITARESRALGFHWIFFPDADVNNNPDNPIINIRSFGESPSDVSRMVSAFIEGAHAAGVPRVLVTAKHFPGQGDTATDTHFNLATVSGDRARLEQVEWMPFRAAIQSGADAVMTGHLAVPALEEPTLPATLSTKILTGVLRGDLGFKGIVVTDALQMGGIAEGFSVGDACVRAIEAGTDVLLMPSEPVACINAVTTALKSGRLTRQRIEESLMRVLLAKAHVGLAAQKLVDIAAIPRLVNTRESQAVAQDVADHSITLVRNRNALIPLQSTESTAFFILSEKATGIEGQATVLELRKRVPGADVIEVDAKMSAAELQMAARRGASASKYVVAAFASVAAFRGNPPLGGVLPQFVGDLIATKKPVVFVALGNPYLLRAFPGVDAYLTAYSTVPPSEVSAVKALFGEIPLSGRLPVTIPGLAKFQDGIQAPSRHRAGL